MCIQALQPLLAAFHVPQLKFSSSAAAKCTGGGLDFDLMNAIGLGRFNRTASERSESDPEVELAMDDAKQPNPAYKGELPVAEKPVVA